MVTLELEGRSVGIAPYRLGSLRKAAPFIDEINELVQRVTASKADGVSPKLADATALTRACCEVLAIGALKIDPTLDADALEEAVPPGLGAVQSLQFAVFELLAQSGLSSSGEAQASTSEETVEAEAEAEPA